MSQNKSLVDLTLGQLLGVWLATLRKALKITKQSMNGVWKIPVKMSLVVGFIWIQVLPHILNSYRVLSWAGSHAHASVVCCRCCRVWRQDSFEAKNADSSFLFSLSVLPSFRGCLKLPSLTLFTFSLFYRYREEMAWNSAVFRTLDKLHCHSKWIYINKETDTLQWDESREHKRWRGGVCVEHSGENNL